MTSARSAVATGIEIAYDDLGAGPPMILLHAWGECRGTFARLVPLLQSSCRLLVPDLRGSGESSKPESGYSLAESAADVVALLDAVGIESAWVLGTSSGGYLAQQVAIDHPARCRGLVLVGSPRSLAGLDPPFRSLLADLTDPISRDVVEAVNGTVGASSAIPRDVLDRSVEDALTIPAHVWRASFEGLIQAVPPTEVATIEIPTLILWGADDDLLPADEPHAMQAAIPGSTLRKYPGVGHLVLWEQPEQVAADVLTFVR